MNEGILTKEPDNSKAMNENSIEENEKEILEKEKIAIEEEKEKLKQREKELSEKETQLSQKQESISIICEGEWKAEYEAVVGLKHRKTLLPTTCQDAALAILAPRPIVITADGAGSAIMSDIGAKRVVSGVRRLIDTLYNSQFSALDRPELIDINISGNWSLILTKHAKGILEDLSIEYQRPSDDFRCTLLVAIIGKCHTFWFRVGDGALVVERQIKPIESEMPYSLEPLGISGKGSEYANETVFISKNLQPDQVTGGVLPSNDVSAVFSMSDGAATKLVKNDFSKAAPILSDFSQKLRKEELSRITLTKFFYSEKFLEGNDGDDCSIAMVAR